MKKKKWNNTFGEWFRYIARSKAMRKAKDKVILKAFGVKW